MKLSTVSELQKIASNVGNVMKIQVRGRKQNTCYLPVCDAKIVEPKKDSQELCKAGQFIAEQYFPHEPILKANEIKPTQTLVQYYMGAANVGSLMYNIVEDRDGSEKVGLLIAHPITSNSSNEILTLARRIRDKPTRNYLTLLAELEKKKDIINLYSTSKVLSVDVLTTTLDYRRRGVSKQLLTAVVEQATKNNYDVIRFTTASEYATKAAAGVGFKSIYSGAPEALRDDKGEALVPSPLCIPHKTLQIMVIDLRKIAKPVKEKEKPCKFGDDF